MATSWPIQEIETANRQQNFDGDVGVFRKLRTGILRTDKAKLVEKASDAEPVWIFLLTFCEKRKTYRRQVLECVNVLMECDAWQQAFSSQPSLKEKAQSLPEDVQVALAVQHEVIMKSMTPAQMAKMQSNAAAVPEEFKRDQVLKSIAAFKVADKLQTDMIEETAKDVQDVPDFQMNDPLQPTEKEMAEMAEQLHEGIEAVLDIEDPISFENKGVSAFVQLRRGCLHAVSTPEAFDREVGHAPEVLNFLIDFTKRHHRIRIKQICETMNLLMGSPAWLQAFESSPMIVQRVQEELSEDQQIALGLQHEQIMQAISATARKKAAEEEAKGGAAVIQAKKVADQMKTLRQSFVPSRIGGDKAPAPPPPAPAPAEAEEWFETATGDGKKYYYNKCGQSAWTLPKGAVLTQREQVPAVAMKEGDKVEVFSNSQQKWLPGVVEKVGATIDVAFQLPGAAPDQWARKQLPAGSKDVRRAGISSSRVGTAGSQASPTAWAARDKVDVFSNSKQIWLSGVIEKVTGDTLLVAFQLPGAGPDQWARKEVSASSKDIRKPSAVSTDAGQSQADWTAEEQALYLQLWQGLSKADAQTIADFLRKANLPAKCLKEIWQCGNPEGKQPGQQEFYMYCRLVAHCQTTVQASGQAALLNEGGRALRGYLRQNCMGAPPKMPTFAK